MTFAVNANAYETVKIEGTKVDPDINDNTDYKLWVIIVVGVSALICIGCILPAIFCSIWKACCSKDDRVEEQDSDEVPHLHEAL